MEWPESNGRWFTWSDFQARNNNELVAIFGNFINRVLVLTQKYWNGVVPEATTFTKNDTKVLNQLEKFPNLIGEKIEKFKFREALQNTMDLARLGNKYLAENEPWKLKSTDEERTKTILYVAIQICASLAILSEPFMPFASKKLKQTLSFNNLCWDDAGGLIINANHKINISSHLFSKIEDEKIAEQLEKLKT